MGDNGPTALKKRALTAEVTEIERGVSCPGLLSFGDAIVWM